MKVTAAELVYGALRQNIFSMRTLCRNLKFFYHTSEHMRNIRSTPTAHHNKKRTFTHGTYIYILPLIKNCLLRLSWYFYLMIFHYLIFQTTFDKPSKLSDNYICWDNRCAFRTCWSIPTFLKRRILGWSVQIIIHQYCQARLQFGQLIICPIYRTVSV